MSKIKLTFKQKARITTHRKKLSDACLGNQPVYKGLVIAHFGKQLEVKNLEGQIVVCKKRNHLEEVVTGDWVNFSTPTVDEGVIISIEPRQSSLTRYVLNKEKIIAANIDRAFIVVAVEPPPSNEILDSYLIMCELNEIQPFIILNKNDLLTKQNFSFDLNLYQKLGYPLISTNTYIDDRHLKDYFINHCSILIGQSGVGKSSILGNLLPDVKIKVGDLTNSKLKGRHTTTTSRLYELNKHSFLIDSPGIRQYSLKYLTPQKLAYGYKEFRLFLNLCYFKNCTHVNTRGCALLSALDDQHISALRLSSYQKLLREIIN